MATSIIKNGKPVQSAEINDKRKVKDDQLPTKIYEPRNSLLTDLIEENKEVRSIYNLAIALFIGTLLSAAVTDLVNDGWIYLGFRTIENAFRNLHCVVFPWIVMFLTSLAVYYGFITWAKMRKQFYNQRKLLDMLWFTLFISYYPGLLYFAAKVAIIYNLGIASSLTMVMEATRFLMKAHAFVRSNAPRHLVQSKETLYPTFSHYLYFSFAPVLVYKDTYPRCNRPIKWEIVCKSLLEFVSAIIFYSIIFERTFIYGLSDYGIKTYTWKDIIMIVFQNFHVGIILCMLFFYAALHSYFNITSELLGFSDRLMYKDWWAASRADEQLRKWNVLVHDYLYTYIYKDLYENVFRGYKLIPKLAVFLISAAFHDYIVCVSSRMFIPITSVLYIIPVILTQFKNPNKKYFGILMWIGFGISISLNFTILSVEYFARQNCPLDEASFFDMVKPRFLYC